MPAGSYTRKPENNLKMSARLKGRIISNEHREKISLALIGKKKTPEAIRKVALALTGRKQSPEHIEKRVTKTRGQKRSDELRQRMSENAKRLGFGRHGNHPRREKRWNWKGGITSQAEIIRHSPQYKIWRKAIFERDNYTCIWCGSKSMKGFPVVLNADHIKPFALFPELRFAIDNGRTLCEPCHRTTDTYGVKAIKL